MNEWKLLDELGKKLTLLARDAEKLVITYRDILEAKDLVNKLKSEVMKNRKEEPLT